MKKIKIFILTLFLLIPTIVKAHTIECDNGSFSNGQKFTCYVNVKDKVNYDELSGSVSTDANIKCEINAVGAGLTAGQVLSPKSQFKLTGTPTGNSILKIACEVIGKPDEQTQSQVIIRDYKYHKYGDSNDAESLVLRSNFIPINKYVEQEEKPVTDDKPRDTSNNNSLLKTIFDKNLNFSFSKFITIYDIEVLYEVEELEIIAMPVNNAATIKIEGNQKLTIGKNVIDIYVTSPDNKTTTCYTLNVTRLARGEEIYYPKSDSSLESLTVIGHSIKFEKEVYDYTINIDSKTDKVEVNPTPTNEEAKVDISNTDNLSNGDLITITVTSADGTTETKYRIRVLKELPKEDITLYLILGGIALIGVGVIVLIIKNNKKEKEDPLLSIKTDKRKVKKGAGLDTSTIPDADLSGQTVSTTPQQPISPNVITESSAVANIIQPATQPVSDDRNKVTALQSTIDLNVAAKAAPIAIAVQPTPTTEGPQVNNNSIGSSLGTEAATLDLSSAVAPMDLNNIAVPVNNQINSNVLAPQQQVVGNIQNNPGITEYPTQTIQPIPQVVNPQQQIQQPVINQVQQPIIPQPMMNQGVINSGMVSQQVPVIEQQQVLDPYINNNLYSDQNIIASSGPVQTIQLDQVQQPISQIQNYPVEQQVAPVSLDLTAQPVQTIQLDATTVPQNIGNPNNNQCN